MTNEHATESDLTHARHEENAKAFVAELDRLLVDAMELSALKHPQVFDARNALRHSLMSLLRENTYLAITDERSRLKKKIADEIGRY